MPSLEQMPELLDKIYENGALAFKVIITKKLMSLGFTEAAALVVHEDIPKRGATEKENET